LRGRQYLEDHPEGPIVLTYRELHVNDDTD
jgi:hypothetical protein